MSSSTIASSLRSDAPFQHGSESARIDLNHRKAPSSIDEWTIRGKDEFEMDLKERGLWPLLDGTETYPTKQSEILELARDLYGNPTLSQATYQAMLNRNIVNPIQLTRKELKEIKKEQKEFLHKETKLITYFFKYCLDTSIGHLNKKYKESKDFKAFYADIIKSFESTGQNNELTILKMKIQEFIPPLTSNPINDFLTTCSTVESYWSAIENLDSEFSIQFKDSHKINELSTILFKDKEKRFREILKRSADGTSKSLTKWKEQFETLYNAYVITNIQEFGTLTSAADYKSIQIKSENSSISSSNTALTTNLSADTTSTETTIEETETENALNSQIHKLKLLKFKKFPNSKPVLNNSDNEKNHNNSKRRWDHRHSSNNKRGRGNYGNKSYSRQNDYSNSNQNSSDSGNSRDYRNNNRGGRGRGRGRGGRGGRGNSNYNSNYNNYNNNYSNWSNPNQYFPQNPPPPITSPPHQSAYIQYPNQNFNHNYNPYAPPFGYSIAN